MPPSTSAQKQKQVVPSTLPITLQALRERAGFGDKDGARGAMREFFSESKFTGDPDRDTAIAMVAVDTILRDPSMLDGTTCFGEGQIDTAVGAAKIILGEKKLEGLLSISGEHDIEQLAEKCASMASDRDIKAGCVAARHLWGVFNTAVRSFPSSLYRNGAFDNFQIALLASAGRHLGVFNPDDNDLTDDFYKIVARAEKISELGGDGKFHKEPKTEKEAAESVMFLAKNGRFGELRDSSVVDMVKGDPVGPSPKICKQLGIRKTRGKGRKMAGKDGSGREDGAWMYEEALAGNGAFFAGRTYDEIKSRYPGYPGHRTDASYWDSCARHPATHGICCRLYSKVPLLTKVGGVEEGLSRAVTNKMVHHNTKFSRLSLWVKLSNGKGFWVHRTRPINWASHGVDTPPFQKDAQLDLFSEGDKKNAKKSKGGVSVVGFELKAMNYSHMPWVNKAISQYVEEAPFIHTPSDEHQECLGVLSKSLREAGVKYRDSIDTAAQIYSLLPGRGIRCVEMLENKLKLATRDTQHSEELEAEIAAAARAGKLRALLEQRDNDNNAVPTQAREALDAFLKRGEAILGSIGIAPSKVQKIVDRLVSEFPSGVNQNGREIRDAVSSYPESAKISDSDLLRLSREVTGLSAKALSAIASIGEEDKKSLAKLVGKVIGSGVYTRGELENPDADRKKNAISAFMEKASRIIEDKLIDRKTAVMVAEECLGDAVDIAPEVEIRLARDGAVVSDKDRDVIFSYCAKYAEKFPMSSEDLHNRAASFGGGLTISLDAPVGDDNKSDMYSIFGGGGAGVQGEESPSAHFLDSISEHKNNDRPGFVADGGDELMQPFGMSSMTDSLYKVVSTSGTDIQKGILEDFANAQVEAAVSRGGVESAKEQISAMLDLLDREDALPMGEASTRRKVLSWVFQSVMNAAGVDGQGFEKLGGGDGEGLRRSLLSKIRRYGMPGVLVSSGEPQVDADFESNIAKLKSWGYERLGICIPKSCEENLIKWSRGGRDSTVDLLLGVRGVSEEEFNSVKRAVSFIEDDGIKRAAAALLDGQDTGSGEASKYISSRRDAEDTILGVIKNSSPALHNKLHILSTGTRQGFSFDFLGDGKNADSMADAARLDSVLFVDGGIAGTVASKVSSFGIDTAVYQGSPDAVLARHADYLSNGINQGGVSAKIRESRIPLPKKLALAALAAHENTIKH